MHAPLQLGYKFQDTREVKMEKKLVEGADRSAGVENEVGGKEEGWGLEGDRRRAFTRQLL